MFTSGQSFRFFEEVNLSLNMVQGVGRLSRNIFIPRAKAMVSVTQQ
jgi:hypothetical protein